MKDCNKTKKEVMYELEIEKSNVRVLEAQIEQQVKNYETYLKEQEDKYDQLYTEGQAWNNLAREYAGIIYQIRDKYNKKSGTLEEFLNFFIQTTNISTPFDEEFEQGHFIGTEELSIE